MKAERFPYFPFYVGDFLRDPAVEAMDTRAVGAFLLLLLRAWDEKKAGTIPTDDATLRRWSRMDRLKNGEPIPDEQWSDTRDQVLAAFKLSKDETRWEQRRMMREHAKIRKSLSGKSKGGKKGAAKRWDTHNKAMGNSGYQDQESDSESKSDQDHQADDGGKVGDRLDTEIHSFVRGHKFVTWSPIVHSSCRKLVESVGWSAAKHNIDEAVKRGAKCPVRYALGIAMGDAQQEGAASRASGPQPEKRVPKNVTYAS